VVDRYREELTGRVLPFWLRHTLDRVHGGYYNCVDRQGRVYDTRKHIWMQGRGAWMFARLFNTFDPLPEYKEAAGLIFQFLHAHARNGEQRCWFSVAEDGKPGFFQRKPYSAFFVALALVEYSKISKDPAHVAEAVELFWRIEEWIRRPELLGRGPLGYSQLADLYVMGWLAHEIGEVHADPRYEGIIRDCSERLLAHYEPSVRVFKENASFTDESLFRKYPEGRAVCTGSSLEIAWLFLRILRRVPNARLERVLLESILGALEYGWDPKYGGLFYFQDLERRPSPMLESNMKLWWSHTEAILAAAMAFRRTGDSRYMEWWKRVDEYAFRVFADREFGEWFGYCDRQGNVATELKGGPYKGIFHVPRFLLFTIEECSRP